MVDIKLKKADLNDYNEILKIEKTTEDYPYYYTCVDEKKIKDFIKNNFVNLILFGNEIVGTISYNLDNKDFVYVRKLVIVPEFRRKGFARGALNKLIEMFPGIKFRMFVHPNNKLAIDFYITMGFVVKGWKDDYFGDGEPRLLLETI